MRQVETLEAIRWAGAPAGTARRGLIALVWTVALAGVLGWAAWRPTAPVPPPRCSQSSCPTDPAIEAMPSMDLVAASVARAVLAGEEGLPHPVMDNAERFAYREGGVERWNTHALDVIARFPPGEWLETLSLCSAEDEACARWAIGTRAPAAEADTVSLAAWEWSQVRLARIEGLAPRHRAALDQEAYEAARAAWHADVAVSDQWHGPRWLRGLYAIVAFLTWLTCMVALGWRSRPLEVELRSGTLRVDDLVLPLDQVAAVATEGGQVRLQLHTGDELWTRSLGPMAAEVVARVPVSPAPADPAERRAVEGLLRSVR